MKPHCSSDQESSSDESLSSDVPRGHKRKFADLEPDDNATDIEFAKRAHDDHTDGDVSRCMRLPQKVIFK